MGRLSVAATALFIAVSAPVAHSAERVFPDIAETAKADPQTVDFFRSYFTAKSQHDVEATMSFFSPQLLTYTDAILGWPLNDFKTLKDVFAQYMPKWGDGKSYPFRIIGGPDSAVVAFIDTPELFGGEIRLLGAVDFKDGKIIRWADYWDSTGFPSDVYNAVRTPSEKFPTEFREKEISGNAAARIIEVATDVQKALAGRDGADIGKHLSTDVVYEDFALRTQLLGKDATTRYLQRIQSEAPFAKGAQLMHIVGGAKGGGFEWRSADDKIRGITALELDDQGLVSRITTTYDGRLISRGAHDKLVSLSSEP